MIRVPNPVTTRRVGKQNVRDLFPGNLILTNRNDLIARVPAVGHTGYNLQPGLRFVF